MYLTPAPLEIVTADQVSRLLRPRRSTVGVGDTDVSKAAAEIVAVAGGADPTNSAFGRISTDAAINPR